MIRALLPHEAAAALHVIHAAFAAQATAPPSGALRETESSIAATIDPRDGGTSGGLGAAQTGIALAGVVLWAVRPGTLYLGRLAVLPAARGSGIGRNLVAAVEDEARRRGLTKVTLGVRLALTANRAFFAACGYRETGFDTHPGYAAPTSVKMERILGP